MHDYFRIPVRVDVVSAQEIITASENELAHLPGWVRQWYEQGRIVISATGVTLLQAQQCLRAGLADFIVRDQHGFIAVYDAQTFQRDFKPAQSAEVFSLYAA